MKLNYLTKDVVLEPLERDMQGKLKGGFGTFSAQPIKSVDAAVSVSAGATVTVTGNCSCGCGCGCGCSSSNVILSTNDPQI